MSNINDLSTFIKQREKYRDIQNEKKEKEKTIVETTSDVPKPKKGKRGRAKIEIEFPKGKFVIPELAKEKKVSVTLVYNALMALGNKVKVVGEQKRKPGARGRATKIYKVID